MRLVGANPAAQITGLDELPGKNNYFIGNDPTKWRTNVPTYAKVRYENVYSGIDLVYYGNQRQLEYDFVVSPGADPGAIRLAFPSVGSHGERFSSPWARSDSFPSRDRKGAVTQPRLQDKTKPLALARGSDWLFQGRDRDGAVNAENPSRDREGAVPLRIDAQGDLVLEAEGSELRLHRPVIYQEISGSRQRIGGNFVIQGGRQVGFEVARYDASKPLIIDPVLSYSTYLGGSGDGFGNGIAVDSSGNAYVTGYTTSPNFPTANAFQAAFGGGDCGTPAASPCADVFVTKLNAAGSALLYSTYLGGSSADYGSRSGPEEPSRIGEH